MVGAGHRESGRRTSREPVRPRAVFDNFHHSSSGATLLAKAGLGEVEGTSPATPLNPPLTRGVGEIFGFGSVAKPLQPKHTLVVRKLTAYNSGLDFLGTLVYLPA